MSNIPNQAVSSAFIPVQRAANDLIRAREVQTRKDHHHSEEVEELDDTAVNSVGDQQQRGGGKKKEAGRENRKGVAGERVEIDSIPAGQNGGETEQENDGAHLDISA